MWKSVSKATAWIIATLASVGIANAKSRIVEVIRPTPQHLEKLRYLLERGVLQQLPVENLFLVSQIAPNADFTAEGDIDAEILGIVELLRAYCGSDLDVRAVVIEDAVLGTQDH